MPGSSALARAPRARSTSASHKTRRASAKGRHLHTLSLASLTCEDLLASQRPSVSAAPGLALRPRVRIAPCPVPVDVSRRRSTPLARLQAATRAPSDPQIHQSPPGGACACVRASMILLEHAAAKASAPDPASPPGPARIRIGRRARPLSPFGQPPPCTKARAGLGRAAPIVAGPHSLLALVPPESSAATLICLSCALRSRAALSRSDLRPWPPEPNNQAARQFNQSQAARPHPSPTRDKTIANLPFELSLVAVVILRVRLSLCLPHHSARLERQVQGRASAARDRQPAFLLCELLCRAPASRA